MSWLARGRRHVLGSASGTATIGATKRYPSPFRVRIMSCVSAASPAARRFGQRAADRLVSHDDARPDRVEQFAARDRAVAVLSLVEEDAQRAKSSS